MIPKILTNIHNRDKTCLVLQLINTISCVAEKFCPSTYVLDLAYEWYGMVWYGMVWYGMVWYGMVWYGQRRIY